MASLNILCSDPHNFLKEITKKIRKETHMKNLCGPSKIFKNISRTINICLKYFMAPAKTLRFPSFILNVRFLKALKQLTWFAIPALEMSIGLR